MTLQYFVTYNLKIAANWHSQGGGEAANGNDTTSDGVWTILFGGGVGRISTGALCILQVLRLGACDFRSR